MSSTDLIVDYRCRNCHAMCRTAPSGGKRGMCPTCEKPLFIPLNAEFWYAFRNGEKTDEIRLYGPRWNEETCRVGLKALLSKGYGKAHRIPAVVAEFHKRDASWTSRSPRSSLPTSTGASIRYDDYFP